MNKAIICDFYGVIFSNFDWKVIDDRIKSNPQKGRQFQDFKDKANKGLIDNIDFRNLVSELAEDSKHKDKAVKTKVSINSLLINYLYEVKQEDLKIALLSNGNEKDIQKQLSYCSCSDLFDAVLTSSRVGDYKPHGHAYINSLKLLNVEPEQCLFIDDSLRHIEGAKKVGLQTHHYTDFEQAKQRIEEFINA